MNTYLQPEDAPVTAERPKLGYDFDTKADRAQVLNKHIKSFEWSKGTGPINSGSAHLTTSGQIAIQTFSGSAILAVSSGTKTYYFTPTGTI